MAKRRQRRVEERDLEGFKLLEPVSELLAALRDESNSNRDLHFDQPTKRTFEAICFYLQGMADVEDVLAGVRRLKPHPPWSTERSLKEVRTRIKSPARAD